MNVFKAILTAITILVIFTGIAGCESDSTSEDKSIESNIGSNGNITSIQIVESDGNVVTINYAGDSGEEEL